MRVEVRPRVELSEDERALLESDHRVLGSLGSVMTWAHRQRPALRILDLVTQDEFTHDVVVGPWRGHVLVYDTT